MGNNHPATSNILIHGGEFDDIFLINELTKLYPSIEWLEYMTCNPKRYDAQLMSAKNILANCMGFNINIEPTNISYNILKYDLRKFKDVDGFKIRTIITGSGADFIKLLTKLIMDEEKESYFNPAEIELIIIISRHNSRGLFDALVNLYYICELCNIDLTIRASNISSQEPPKIDSLYNTSQFFQDKIVGDAKKNNFAKCIIQYGLMINGYIIKNIIPQIISSIEEMRRISYIDVDSYKLPDLADNIPTYINRLITKVDGILVLNYELCARLSGDLTRFVQCAQAILYRVELDLQNGLISFDHANKYMRRMNSIKNRFLRKVELTESNLIYFPLKNLTACFMIRCDDVLSVSPTWASRSIDHVKVSNERPYNGKTFPLMVYESKQHKTTLDKMEEIIYAAIAA